MRKINLHIRVTEYDDGAKFYEWDMIGVKREEAEELLAAIGRDMGRNQMIVLKEASVKAERNLCDVLEKMSKEIPDSFEQGTNFKASLRSVTNVAKYATPERTRELWSHTANLLERYLGDPDEEWKRRIASIFAGRSSI